MRARGFEFAQFIDQDKDLHGQFGGTGSVPSGGTKMADTEVGPPFRSTDA